MVFIFAGSSDVLSAEHTSRFLFPFLHWLKPNISLVTILKIHFFMRKLGHVTEYAILAMLLYRALVNSFWRGRPWRCAIVVIVLCGAYAASDEFHQSFVPSRTASARDVAIDLCGAVLSVMIYWLFAMGVQKFSTRAIDR